jgi:hypothetical protein
MILPIAAGLLPGWGGHKFYRHIKEMAKNLVLGSHVAIRIRYIMENIVTRG